MIKIELAEVYQGIADLTLGHCKRTCKNIGSCCSQEYCAMSIEMAKEDGVVLAPTGRHLPLMSDTGCTSPPHYRPLCSRHSCDINGIGVFRNEPELTSSYFKMCDRASELELRLYYPDAVGKLQENLDA